MFLFRKNDYFFFKFTTKIKLPLSLLDIYITKELTKYFLFSFAIFFSLGIALGVGYDLIYEMIDSGLSIIVALQILGLKIPELIVYILPISLLLSCILTYTNFSNNNELIAFQSVGLSLTRLIYPAIIIGLITCFITFPIYNFIVPETNFFSRITALKATKKDNYSIFKNKPIFEEYQTMVDQEGNKYKKLTKIFYVKQIESQNLKNIILIDISREDLKQVTIAESATINLWTNTWNFRNGEIYIFNKKDESNFAIKFKHKSIYLPLDNRLLNLRNRQDNELSLHQLKSKIQKTTNNDMNQLQIRLCKYFSVPMIPIFFSFLGAMLGIRLDKLGKSFGFALCVIIVFIYYLISFIGESMAKLEILSPLLGVWLPNILVLIGATLLSHIPQFKK